MERELKLLDAVPYLRAYQDQLFVIKLGGELMDKPARLQLVVRDIAVLHRLGIRVVVVHGGGPQLDRLTERIGLEVETVGGRRITSPEVLEAAKMVFRGQLSIDLVSAIAREGERAVGVSGVDGGCIQAKRRDRIMMRTDTGEMKEVDFGQVGDVTRVEGDVLEAMIRAKSIAVVSPLAVTSDGTVLNVNADTVAAEIAIALKAAKLMLLTNVAGILEEVKNPRSLLHWTDLKQLAELESNGAFTGGMRPKVDAIRRALRGGVPRLHVIDARRPGAILEEVFTNDGCGTLVVAEADEAPSELIPTWGI